MSKARLVITAVVIEGRSQSEVARDYGVSQPWVSRLVARYRAEGEAAFEPKSRAPRKSPRSTSREIVAEVTELREDLVRRGLDAGPKTIVWHLATHRGISVSRATVARVLAREGLVTPQPRKRPRSSYVRFEAEMPNECWQSDVTHYDLAGREGRPGRQVEILTFLDDHSRAVMDMSCHEHVTAKIVLAAFRSAVQRHGIPASMLTDNGMVFTTRFAGGKGRSQRLRDRVAPTRGAPEELETQPPPDLREGGAPPADAQEVAGGQAPTADVAFDPAAAVRRLRRGVQLDEAALEPATRAPSFGRLPRATKGSSW